MHHGASIANIAAGDLPRLQKADVPGEPSLVTGSSDLADVGYVCETCGTTSMRRIKLDNLDALTGRPKRRTGE